MGGAGEARGEAVKRAFPADFDELLAELPASSPEHRYHSAVCRAVLAVPLDPASESQGFALIQLLSQGRLVTDQIDTDLSPIGGSIEENSCLVSSLFHRVRRPPTWWKAHYPARIADQDVQDAVVWWVAQLRAVSTVVSVESF